MFLCPEAGRSGSHDPEVHQQLFLGGREDVDLMDAIVGAIDKVVEAYEGLPDLDHKSD